MYQRAYSGWRVLLSSTDVILSEMGSQLQERVLDRPRRPAFESVSKIWVWEGEHGSNGSVTRCGLSLAFSPGEWTPVWDSHGEQMTPADRAAKHVLSPRGRTGLRWKSLSSNLGWMGVLQGFSLRIQGLDAPGSGTNRVPRRQPGELASRSVLPFPSPAPGRVLPPPPTTLPSFAHMDLCARFLG